MHISARKLVSRTSKQVLRNLGPLWHRGVTMVLTLSVYSQDMLVANANVNRLFCRVSRACLSGPFNRDWRWGAGWGGVSNAGFFSQTEIYPVQNWSQEMP